MQCSSCGTTLQPGATICPSCRALVPADTSDVSPYETSSEAVPYIPYTPFIERVSAPPNVPSPGTPAAQQSFYGIGSLPVTPAPQAVPPAGGYGSQASGVAQPTFYPHPQQPLNAVPQPQLFQGSLPLLPVQHRLSVGVTLLLIILALLLIGSVSGVIYYATVPYPAELHAQATAVVQNVVAQSTADLASLTPQQLYTQVTSQRPAINDPLSSQVDSLWGSSSNPKQGCGFTGGAYHVALPSAGLLGCFARNTNFSDFAFQGQMSIIKGDAGGVVFRADLSTTSIRSYLFAIDQRGIYFLIALEGSSNNSKVLSNGPSSAINAGLNQTNLLTVIARSNRFYLYVNKQYITNVSDSTFKSGPVGLSAFAVQNPTETMFSNVQLWTL